MRKKNFAALAVLLAGGSALLAQSTARPVFTPDGVVKVPAFDLPTSGLISPEAAEMQRSRARAAGFSQSAVASQGIDALRAATERAVAPSVEAAKKRYAVNIVPQTIGGVRTRVVTPKAGQVDRSRVLINLHGGAFQSCAEGCAMVESIPISAVGGFKVITVDYRQGPEHQFPAASQDVEKVYRELLKSYRPGSIGIYGCSAGGVLTAQATAWLSDRKLPRPGAIGIFGAGGTRMGTGDSAYIAAYIDGSFPAPRPGGAEMDQGYFRGANMGSPLVSPALHQGILSRFPPTLILTGTRAVDLSAAAYTHSRLLKAGVKSNLLVGEGMGHCYINNSNLPESRDAYDVIVRFFKENLTRAGR